MTVDEKRVPVRYVPQERVAVDDVTEFTICTLCGALAQMPATHDTWHQENGK